MTCKNCGKEFEGGTFCPHCGASQVSANNTTRADDAPSTGYAVLGFFFPADRFDTVSCLESRTPAAC